MQLHKGQPVYFLQCTGEYFTDLNSYQQRQKQLRTPTFQPILGGKKCNLVEAVERDVQVVMKSLNVARGMFLTICLHAIRKQEVPKSASSLIGYFARDSLGQLALILGTVSEQKLLISLISPSDPVVKLVRGIDVAFIFDSEFQENQELQTVDLSTIRERRLLPTDIQLFQCLKQFPAYLSSSELSKVSTLQFKDYSEMKSSVISCLIKLDQQLLELPQKYKAEYRFCRCRCPWPFMLNQFVYEFMGVQEVENQPSAFKGFKVLTEAQAIQLRINIEQEIVNDQPAKKKQTYVIQEQIKTEEPVFDEYSLEQKQLRIQYNLMLEQIQAQIESTPLNQLIEAVQNKLSQIEAPVAIVREKTERKVKEEVPTEPLNVRTEHVQKFFGQFYADNEQMPENVVKLLSVFQFINQNCEFLQLKQFCFKEFANAIAMLSSDQNEILDPLQIEPTDFSKYSDDEVLKNMIPLYNKNVQPMTYQILQGLVFALFKTEPTEELEFQLQKKKKVKEIVKEESSKSYEYEYEYEEDENVEEDDEPVEEENGSVYEIQEESESEWEDSDKPKKSKKPVKEDSFDNFIVDDEYDIYEDGSNSSDSYAPSPKKAPVKKVKTPPKPKPQKQIKGQKARKEPSPPPPPPPMEPSDDLPDIETFTTFKQIAVYNFTHPQAFQGSRDECWIEHLLQFIVQVSVQEKDLECFTFILPVLSLLSSNPIIDRLMMSVENIPAQKDEYFWKNLLENLSIENKYPIKFYNEYFNTHLQYIEEMETELENVQRVVQMNQSHQHLTQNKTKFQHLPVHIKTRFMNWIIEQVLQSQKYQEYTEYLEIQKTELNKQKKEVKTDMTKFAQDKEGRRADYQLRYNAAKADIDALKIKIETQKMNNQMRYAEQNMNKLAAKEQQLNEMNLNTEENNAVNAFKLRLKQLDDQVGHVQQILNRNLVGIDLVGNQYFVSFISDDAYLFIQTTDDRVYLVPHSLLGEIIQNCKHPQLERELQQVTVYDVPEDNCKEIDVTLEDMAGSQGFESEDFNQFLRQQPLPAFWSYMLLKKGPRKFWIGQEVLEAIGQALWK
ncbi:Conserved_hypothetical protein [Hexamita inflata]|uniref:Uncharacterized protein n=1 Tax=Hexamita inflata TaxID=28002 RepID=A0AA86PJ37_9EUKA|nr:Conserved hypothetical protein [Hexamita inflata]